MRIVGQTMEHIAFTLLKQARLYDSSVLTDVPVMIAIKVAVAMVVTYVVKQHFSDELESLIPAVTLVTVLLLACRLSTLTRTPEYF